MNVDDNFYDEISSLLPPPDDYGLNDLDDIIGSTVSPLDTTLDLHSFATQNDAADFGLPSAHTNFMQSSLFQLPQTMPELDFNLSAFPSPAQSLNDSLSNVSPPHSVSQRKTSSSTSSSGAMECDYGNLEEFLNFINDDDMKIEELTRDSLLEHVKIERDTPSPTGSCSSSGSSSGSSTTSGVHSDASSIASLQPTNYTDESNECDKSNVLLRQVDVESACGNEFNVMPQFALNAGNENTIFMLKDEELSLETPQQLKPMSVLTLPAAPIQTTPPSINPLQNTLTPVQPMPVTITNNNTAPLKVESKLAPKNAATQIKLQTATKAANLATTPATNTTTTTHANGKPKTIFLSTNDFKALMQKMNTTNGKGAKINGSVNAQMPKIIMKTANGKVIATNKIVQPLNATHMGTKIVKTNAQAPIFLNNKSQTQQANKLNANNRPGINTTASNAGHQAKPDISIYKGMIDEKILKKQQRMIKNRESASLSRKKKKEYVVSLETRINNLEKENNTLRGDNTSLRNQLVAFAKTCNCRHGNVSQFVLNSLDAADGKGDQHVKIAPRPASKSFKQRMTAATVKKNVAVLFAMAFMVTLNVGNFQNYLNNHNIDGDGSGILTDPIAEEPMSSGRRLLWVDTEQEYNDKLNRSKRALELEVPPLHFLRPTNRSGAGNSSAAAADRQNYGKANEPPSPPPLTPTTTKCNGGCNAQGNQTENLRLASNLHKWIGGNDYLNLSMHTKYGNELDNPHGFKVTTDYLELKTMERKRKIYMDDDYEDGKSAKKLDKKMTSEHTRLNEIVNGNSKGHMIDENSLKLFKPKIDDEYLRLFKGIKRQDDTFYVLSFNLDHILLPASAYNKSTRPKMSLMLPASDPTMNGDIVLMKIDCEVFNTTQLELKSHMIPTKLRPNVRTPTTPKPNDVANNETQASATATNKTRDKLPLKYEQPKEKPPVRTYIMVGPKNQAAAAASAQKPRIVRLNSSTANTTHGQAHGMGTPVRNAAPHVKNSTLFTKMRETVQGEFGP